MRLLAALALLSGCDVVFGIQERVDAMPMPDTPLADAAVGCWTVQFQDHDEDNDGRMDGCDNCPAIANATQDDADKDGVGDACDGSTGQDRIAYFRPFSSSSDIDGTEPAGGTWSVVGDALVQDSDAGATALLIPGTFVGARVFTQVVNISTGTSDVRDRSAVVVASGDPKQETGITCGVHRRYMMAAVATLGRANTMMGVSQPGVFAGGVEIQLATSGPAGTPVCVVALTPPAALALDGVGPTSGRVGFATTESTAQFLSITVITPQ